MENPLLYIQSKLKAPKSQYNSFGKYSYRNCEDILNAVKPLLKETGLTLTISDDLVMIGGRYYVRATAFLKSEDMAWQVNAFAREAETKKGMDPSQITGAASSYARKYALNGLFCIDDTKDADSDVQKPAKPPEKERTKQVSGKTFAQTVKELKQGYLDVDGDDKRFYSIMHQYGVNKPADADNVKVQQEIVKALAEGLK